MRRRASRADWVAQSPESKALAKELKKRGFRFVGPTTAYSLMQAAGIVNDHAAGCCVARRGRGGTARGGRALRLTTAAPAAESGPDAQPLELGRRADPAQVPVDHLLGVDPLEQLVVQVVQAP